VKFGGEKPDRTGDMVSLIHRKEINPIMGAEKKCKLASDFHD